MKEVMKLRNNLSEIIKGKVTQKELAAKIGVTEATLSDFMNMKRSTINIELINSILTAFQDGTIPKDDTSSLGDNLETIMSSIFKPVRTFHLDVFNLHKEGTFLQSPTADNIYFSYSNNPNDSYIETMEVLTDGRVLVTNLKIPIEDFTPEKIKERFEKHENKVDEICPEYAINEEFIFVHQFINVTIYEGKMKKVEKYPSEKDAIGAIRLLYM